MKIESKLSYSDLAYVIMDSSKRNRDEISSPDTPEKQEELCRISRQKTEYNGGHHPFINTTESTLAYPESSLFVEGVTMSEQGITTSEKDSPMEAKSSTRECIQEEPVIDFKWLCNAFTTFQAQVSKKLEKLDKIDNIVTSLDQLKSDVHIQNDNIVHLKDENEKLKAAICQLNVYKQKVTDLEIYTKRNNLIFDGVEQDSGPESYSSLLSKLHNIFEQLGIPDPKDIAVETVHRLGRKIAGKPQSLIARFVKFNDRQMIWSKRFL